MADLITQIEMMKFSGMKRAVFPSGTVITPSAGDWAKEHGIDVVLGDEQSVADGENGMVAEKARVLRTVSKVIVDESTRQGISLSRDELIEAVGRCLEKIGHTVER